MEGEIDVSSLGGVDSESDIWSDGGYWEEETLDAIERVDVSRPYILHTIDIQFEI